MTSCAECRALTCSAARSRPLPEDCPTVRCPEVYRAAAGLMQGEVDLALWAARVESRGYCRWTRVEEIMEFARGLGWSHLGLAFCMGLRHEAATAAGIFRANGFTVSSVICKTGAVDKADLGLDDRDKLHPGQPEAMCYPVAQAELLNQQGTQFNVVVGLCVGHDSLFFKYSRAPVTVLVAKDRVLAHNPAGALYTAGGYYRRLTRLTPEGP
ncbi:MAG TPA: metal-binding protein [Clostridiales bacterium UBA8153]|nr:metal-binding protein [Clostridiales bacterium UBA8153]